ncbi:hypothetical protein OK016_02335 [Vibrio chagasii]|nr:hypothetical protein [Vibrio chagasii]
MAEAKGLMVRVMSHMLVSKYRVLPVATRYCNGNQFSFIGSIMTEVV